MIKRLCLLATLVFTTTTVHAQLATTPIVSTERRTMEALRINADERVNIDGRLDEPFWQRAVPAADFVQQDPRNGEPPTERTEVRIVYNREHFYMGVTNYDSEPDRLLGNTAKRDEFLSSDDRFMWVIDPFGDQQNGYFFEMNPAGAMGDSLKNATSQINREWDGIWNASVVRNEIGWTIEIDIPFRTLNFNPNVTAWGINFQRTVRRKNEESLWTGWNYNQGLNRFANSGLVTGITDIGQGIGLDLKPYVRASFVDSPGQNNNKWQRDSDAGLDVVYSLTPRLRANFTLNTDFAQTEVDQRQVNLTRFSLFFPERRSFFVEGASFFDFISSGGGGFNQQGNNTAIVPFFTRQIGLKANGVPQKIDFGTKITGQAGRQDIGVLHVRTGEEADAIGEDFTVFRVKRRILAQSYVGTLFTRRDSRGGTTDARYTEGIDYRLSTNRFRGNRNIETSGFYLHTSNPFDTGKSSAFGAAIDYPNDRYDASVSIREVQKNYNPGVGFTLRTGYRRYAGDFRFAPRPRNVRWLRQWATGFNADALTGPADGRLLTRNVEITALNMNLQSQDNFDFRITPVHEYLERPFNIYPGVSLRAGNAYDFTRFRLQGRTANRRIVALDVSGETGNFYSGKRRQLNVNVGVRPRRGMIFSVNSEFNRIELKEGKFSTRLYRLTTDNQFGPWVSFTNSFQYDSVSGMLGWQSRFRWILRPGNDLYFVYNHNWQENRQFDRFDTVDRRVASKIIYTHRF